MAKCIITIEDSAKGHNIKIVFDPPIRKGQERTDAQEFGLQLAKELVQHAKRTKFYRTPEEEQEDAG